MTKPTPDQTDPTRAALAALARPVWLTQAGMWLEALARGFWPVWVVVGLALSALAFGGPDALPQGVVWGLSALVIALVVWFLARGIWSLRLAGWHAAAERFDRATPGRPIQTLTDKVAIGDGDPASQHVWQAHLARVAQAARTARPVAPDLQLSRFDRFGLRYVAAIFVVMAVLFGTGFRSETSLLPGTGGQALATGPAWEGWADPPSYTGLPSLYLNEISAGLSLPQGARLTLRLYAGDERLSVTETVSDAPAPAPSSDPIQEITVHRSGALVVDGPSGQRWDIAMAVDMAPSIEVEGPLSRVGAGEMRLPFHASDDFAVIAGRAAFALDLARVDRRYGLAVAPEPLDGLEVPLPLTLTGNRADFTEVLAEDFSQHPWANLPVALTLHARDDLNQIGQSAPYAMILPGRRFFNPTAAAVIEMRRDLLWSRENAARVGQILRAISHRPDGFMTNQDAFLQLGTATARLLGGLQTEVTPELRDEVSGMLWDAALLFEEGSLADAEARLRRAQEAVQEAIRRGASEDEIARLIQELREAMDDYIRQRAEQAERDGTDQSPPNPDAEQIGEDQIQDLLAEIERLMNEGRMDEAQALLDQLMQMLENMQVREGDGAGEPSPGAQAMDQLQDTLRDQQELSDESFRDMQQGGPQQDAEPGQGQQNEQGQSERAQGEGEQGQSQSGQGGGDSPDAQSLAQRQQALRGQVQEQRQNMPGVGTPEGDSARRNLERAEGAMDRAADALERGDLGDALDRQSEAIDALRDGMQDLGEMMAQDQDRNGAQGQNGQRAEGRDPQGQSDPLGREAGNRGRLGTEDGLLNGEDSQARARELLDEIRRRSAQQRRPEAERDYLRRLLDRF